MVETSTRLQDADLFDFVAGDLVPVARVDLERVLRGGTPRPGVTEGKVEEERKHWMRSRTESETKMKRSEPWRRCGNGGRRRPGRSRAPRRCTHGCNARSFLFGKGDRQRKLC